MLSLGEYHKSIKQHTVESMFYLLCTVTLLSLLSWLDWPSLFLFSSLPSSAEKQTYSYFLFHYATKSIKKWKCSFTYRVCLNLQGRFLRSRCPPGRREGLASHLLWPHPPPDAHEPPPMQPGPPPSFEKTPLRKKEIWRSCKNQTQSFLEIDSLHFLLTIVVYRKKKNI